MTVDQIAEKHYPILSSDCVRMRSIKNQLRQQLKNDINLLLDNEQKRATATKKPVTKGTR